MDHNVKMIDRLIDFCISPPGLTTWLTPEDNPPLGLNILKLEDIRESANYTCEAASVLGVIESTAEVKVQCEYLMLNIKNDGIIND